MVYCEVSHEWLDFSKYTHHLLGEFLYKEKLSHGLYIHGIPRESIAWLIYRMPPNIMTYDKETSTSQWNSKKVTLNTRYTAQLTIYSFSPLFTVLPSWRRLHYSYRMYLTRFQWGLLFEMWIHLGLRFAGQLVCFSVCYRLINSRSALSVGCVISYGNTLSTLI